MSPGGLVKFNADTGKELAVAPQENRTEMERARVQARYLMALNCRRDINDVRSELMLECKNPKFAEEAMYEMPVGNKRVRDLSIRFVEAAIAQMGNIDTVVSTVFEDADVKRVNVTVTDLERNASYSTDIDVTKTVERHKAEGEVLGMRKNSYGKDVYIVRADEGALKRKLAAEVSKAVRNNGLRLIPHWLRSECKKVIEETNANDAALDPMAAMRGMVDKFRELGISASELSKWLGRQLDGATAEEVSELRAVFMAIRDNMCTWREALEARHGTSTEQTEENKAVLDKITTIKKKLQEKRKKDDS